MGDDDTKRILQLPSHSGIFFQVTGAGPVSIRRQLDVGDSELAFIAIVIVLKNHYAITAMIA